MSMAEEEGLEMGLTKCNITPLVALSFSLLPSYFSRRLPVRVEHLRRSLTTRPPPRVDKLLQEDLAKDPVRLFEEESGEDDSHAILRG